MLLSHDSNPNKHYCHVIVKHDNYSNPKNKNNKKHTVIFSLSFLKKITNNILINQYQIPFVNSQDSEAAAIKQI